MLIVCKLNNRFFHFHKNARDKEIRRTRENAKKVTVNVSSSTIADCCFTIWPFLSTFRENSAVSLHLYNYSRLKTVHIFQSKLMSHVKKYIKKQESLLIVRGNQGIIYCSYKRGENYLKSETAIDKHNEI